ncbi:hypothetical protein L226DRAFT_569543 [Lentinus tigrinus ALCF2SS1-7]|uniref:BTB domain-containing protein n=1 Tax=Lentinus tigrinus ALCF2SS1-6 TaxID=1328759 RepID=A0A5C2SJZ1_9APHY|nr:hypothetical protein L227DRAFT_607766 [Lentinus tigrinus ALCF2SS1-6]RPD76254.1 hypothetical protein L226DRAFT_569543 [Lentinus tigrinus ALCF2SS1-7]
MSDQPPQPMTPSKASHPFDDLSADIILRTPDLIDFYVHSPILSYASPVFSSMLSLPQPGHAIRTEQPVVDVSEDSQALDRLLRLCYPMLKPELSELREIVPVLKAALKYEMEWPVLLLSKDLLGMVPSSPLKVWAAACRAGLEDVARAAASEIRRRVSTPNSGWVFPAPALSVLAELLEDDTSLSNLQDISAGDYFRLREFLRLPDTHAECILPFVKPDTHVLLQCRDRESVQHRAHGVVLALHSTLLGEQVAQAKVDHAGLNGNNADTEGTSSGYTELPLLQLDVSSDALASLLTICYDGPSGLPSSLTALATMLVASRDLGCSQLHSVIAAQWEAAAQSSPLEAYFVAIQYCLKDQARAAARKAVEKSLTGWYTSSMEDTSALAYHRLLVYYDACVRAVEEELKKGINDWSTATQNISGYHNRYYEYCSGGESGARDWMDTYLRGLAERAAREGPGRDWEVTAFQLLEQIGQTPSSFWPSCVYNQCHSLTRELIQIGTSLPKAIADAIAQVELEI